MIGGKWGLGYGGRAQEFRGKSILLIGVYGFGIGCLGIDTAKMEISPLIF